MDKFILKSDFKPTGDQPKAIKKLYKGLKQGFKEQSLLGVTGSGKTFSMANIIVQKQKPTLIISHNKTLAAQLYGELKQFFPDAAVHYFVSYYDYYQPEAYIPQSDTHIEKEATINEEIDRLRHASTQSLINRQDVIIVASVSCIYGIGDKKDYMEMGETFKKGQKIKRNEILRQLIKIQYERNDIAFYRGQFKAHGDVIEIHLSTGEAVIRIELLGDIIENIYSLKIKLDAEKAILSHDLKNRSAYELNAITILPAKHFITSEEKRKKGIIAIKKELEERLKELKKENKLVEAYRLEQKTNYDLEMMEQIGYCNGIENYSQHLSGRPPGEAPQTLIDFFPKDFLMFIDESHVSLPQIRGMYAGDQSRKQTLVDFGFRLPSAKDNRPLNYQEFRKKINQVIYLSATLGEYEIQKSTQIAEQIIRPTGLLDPEIIIRKSTGQINDLIKEIRKTTTKKQQVLVTTLTKRMAEELSEYLKEQKIKVEYLHSDIDTLERVEILDRLKRGNFDVLVGINLLREGLDLPEVSLVAILDADMSGFLRHQTALMQTIGRAARHIEGRAILYADKITPAIRYVLKETKRRRTKQIAYNKKYKIKPRSIKTKFYEKII